MKDFFAFTVLFIRDFGINILPLLQLSVEGTLDGFQEGMKKGGLIPALTGAASGATEGADKGVYNGFGRIGEVDMNLRG